MKEYGLGSANERGEPFGSISVTTYQPRAVTKEQRFGKTRTAIMFELDQVRNSNEKYVFE